MTEFARYAIYYAPREGVFADACAAWLGWDMQAGRAVAQPDLPGLPRPLAELTRAPRKYGFHGTIRAPFRPACNEARLIEAVEDCAASLAPLRGEGLALADLHGFLALLPEGCDDGLHALGEAVVRATDPLRLPLTEAEIARRRPEALSPRQRDLLDRWGYPFVMEEFRFHLTLTDQLRPGEQAPVMAALSDWLAPSLPRPFVIEDLCLVGEDQAGRFHLVHRAALSG